ncbi:MAG TPA: Rab family GTPase [Candidatus Lokiarchaeia archaeon]|nr:Rab family GTPase [Candidatus Lokiarchaeia archaeon]
MESDQMTANFKIVLVGDEAVGKTSLVRRLIDENFLQDYLPTLGFEISCKNIEIEGINITFTIWDIGGQQIFEPIRRSYYTESRGFLLVFNLANRVTFRNVDYWVSEVRETCPGAPIILVGAKADLDEWHVTAEDVEQKANELQLDDQIITSAKTNEGVVDAFTLLAQAILKNREVNAESISE